MTPRMLIAVCCLSLAGFQLSPAFAAAPARTRGGAAKTATKSGSDKADDKTPFKSGTFSALSFRGLGPAVNSGRIIDMAIHPSDRNTWYVAAASGGVWKTTNAANTWTPIFDGEGSFSIGCVTIDPRDPLVVWVGTGENNSQRSVAYGDGVYRSIDGGKSWENMGLKASEHIGMIVVDPRDSNVVYVAAQGPLWSSGGDRGLYRTTDGGKSWTRVLDIDENTGVSEVHLDPRNPDVLYAVSYQRHRRVWTLIDGGPGSGLHKSSDGGTTWRKLSNGLPSVEIGRIGMAVSPVDPNTLYAIVEAQLGKGGVYRSTDAGAGWEKMSDYVSGSPQYYQELVADPVNVDRVYSMDTYLMATTDGGKTWSRVGEKNKHVDNHALIIEPANPKHLIAGCDGGVYESFDRGATWNFKPNLPITQFYRLAVDNAEPFYNVYGGTQDNNTLGGPVRNNRREGIVNSEWFAVVGGDGFQARIDPTDPNIVYGQYQHGGLVRLDRRNGEEVDIQPQPGPGEEGLRWNWDSPLILSPHSHTRLYFAANRLFKSDDRGESWKPLGGDLTRGVDRNRLKVAGRVWSVDAVAKNASTSFFGNIVSLDESPKLAGLLYVGTDDGLIQVSGDDGATWTRYQAFPGVPDMTYVSDLLASTHSTDRVYATFDNHKMGDFKPYVFRSDDRGRSWRSISGDLPERGTAYTIVEDPIKPDLLFAGTEFGVFFTVDGGAKWLQLKGGLPTILVKDIAIQSRESDLVLGTFGRGFYVLDDFSPLRHVTPAALETAALTFPMKRADLFVPTSIWDFEPGESYFKAPNPPFGATLTWYLKEEIKTRKKTRQDAEKKAAKDGLDVFYPTWDELRAEEREEEPQILITVRDAEGEIVRRLTAAPTAGMHRTTWDLRYPASVPASRLGQPDGDFSFGPRGPYVAPGTYTMSIASIVDGVVTPLAEPQSFEVRPLGLGTLEAKDRKAVLAFQKKMSRLQRAALGASDLLSEASGRLKEIRKALRETAGSDPALETRARAIEDSFKDLRVRFSGDSVLERRNEATPPSLLDRIGRVVGSAWYTTADIPATHRREYDIAAAEFGTALETLRQLVDVDLKRLESDAEAAGAPWTPGRVPVWKAE